MRKSTYRDQQMLATDHDARERPSELSVALRTAAEVTASQHAQECALKARVRIACRDALIARLSVVREAIAAGRTNPSYLLSADHLVATVIRDLGGAL